MTKNNKQNYKIIMKQNILDLFKHRFSINGYTARLDTNEWPTCR